MSAETLREAARVLRARAEAATPGPWEAGDRCVWTLSDPLDARPAVIDDGRDGSGGAAYPGDAAYIATMHPGVALALADWLDYTAERVIGEGLRRATPVAEAILGGER